MDGEFHMLNWQLWNGTAEEWDGLLQRFPDYTVYQSYPWGEHRARFGWLALRLVVQDGVDVTAMAQILIRRYPLKIGVVWIPGGPLGDIDLWGENFQRAIRVVTGVRFLYCRLNSMRPHTVKDEFNLTSLGWRRSAYPLNSGLSLVYQPALAEDVRLTQASGNWRHNLRRSFKRGLHVYLWQNPDPNEMMKAYNSMQELKQLNAQTSHQEIESLIKEFSERCLLVRCDDENGNFLALRGALVCCGKAWDMFAVATPDGRKVYASHAAFWELMKLCGDHNVQWYDMSGVDPVNNRGVYDFKKGTGAQDLQYLGEWEYAKPSVFGLLASRIIAQRAQA
jgi:lipid II:glycine glycyltransferase (peptidoglycan interpeptide bridge formation enzyme)